MNYSCQNTFDTLENENYSEFCNLHFLSLPGFTGGRFGGGFK